MRAGAPAEAAAPGSGPEWTSECRARIWLSVDARGRERSGSPARVAVDFQAAARAAGLDGVFHPGSVEVFGYAGGAAPPVRVPHRVDPLFGATAATLAFVVPDARFSDFAVYFDTSAPGGAPRFPGLIGDGDLFREVYGRRGVAASHFDDLADFDGDGDLDLFRGGVEPYVHCYENTGGNRFEYRGRLSSGGELLELPSSPAHRSWVTVAFFDIDRDGDQDFFPSFNDGPESGKILFYENTTPDRRSELTFARRGPLATISGALLAGGAQAGGWFPSITFVRRSATGEDETVDAVAGSGNRCWLYRGLGAREDGSPRFADAVALRAGGREIELTNPRFDCADGDGDGDEDLFAGSQPGPVLYFENIGSAEEPVFAPGVRVAFGGRYLIADAHSGVKAADFDADGLVDFAAGRFWERADLERPEAPRDFGGLWRNAGTAASPRFERTEEGAPYIERFQPCDAVRQNGVRAADWNGDGHLDLLAGDTDGFVWFFAGRGGAASRPFARGERLHAGEGLLSVAARGGHARFDVFDWQNDGRLDLVVADGGGTVTLFLGAGTKESPALAPGVGLEAGGREVRVGTRASALVCDWNADGRKDLVLAGEGGYWWLENTGSDAEPALASPRPILFGGRPVTYVRPNLGDFADWDGDGRRDLIGCHFENSVRLYRNIGSGAAGSEPEFEDPEGVTILDGSSPQMVSGADVADLNGDGDLDIITGQGHGGSGLRFYERDWLEDAMRGTHPAVTARSLERKDDAPRAESGVDCLDVVRRYAGAMLEHGRDTYGPQKSGLFLSALDRASFALLEARPAAPAGIRRGDRPGRAWSEMQGANPQLDQNLLRVLYTLSGITGEPRYARAADGAIGWFFENTMSPATQLLPWGEHLSWDVVLDAPVSGGDEMVHEFARPWVLWDRTFALAPDASARFARGLWEHQIADHTTGAFDRHAPYHEHGPRDGRDFPRHAGFYIATWGHAWKATQDRVYLRAIETLLARFERKRVQPDGTHVATIGPLDCETAAALVPEPLASRLRAFASREDQLLIPLLSAQVAAHESGAPGGAPPEPPMWSSGYSASTLASAAMFSLARHEETGEPAYRRLAVAIADVYIGSRPAEDLDVWPMAFAHAISAQVAAYRFTWRPVYLEQALGFARSAVELYFQDRALPRASLKTGHYETITGADSLALALLEVHAAARGLFHRIPSNTIDR